MFKRLIAIAVLFIVPALAQAETYANLGKISADPGFQQRVQVAMAASAVAVYNEAVVPAPSPYASRHAFAIKVMAGAYNPFAVTFVIVANPTITAEANFAGGGTFAIPDADISSAISAAFNGLAGY